MSGLWPEGPVCGTCSGIGPEAQHLVEKRRVDVQRWEGVHRRAWAGCDGRAYGESESWLANEDK